MTEILNCPRCGSKPACSTSGYFCTSCEWREDLPTMESLIGSVKDPRSTKQIIEDVRRARHPSQEGPEQ